MTTRRYMRNHRVEHANRWIKGHGHCTGLVQLVFDVNGHYVDWFVPFGSGETAYWAKHGSPSCSDWPQDGSILVGHHLIKGTNPEQWSDEIKKGLRLIPSHNQENPEAWKKQKEAWEQAEKEIDWYRFHLSSFQSAWAFDLHSMTLHGWTLKNLDGPNILENIKPIYQVNLG